MKLLIKVCKKDKTYTMKDFCPKCNLKTYLAHPFGISLIKKFEKYKK